MERADADNRQQQEWKRDSEVIPYDIWDGRACKVQRIDTRYWRIYNYNMNRFRIGNDIAIKWTITRGDEAEDLTRVIVKKVYIVCPNWETELQYRIEGDDNNVLVLLFAGKEQKYCGPYWLRLEENPGEDNMNVIESQPMFMLRPVTDGAAIMPVAVTELATNVMLPQNGLSAYDIAVIHGYEGTEEEWAARTEDDHTRAEEDHTRAASDHTTAASDHTRAASDHTTAASDHTQALSDKSQAASDHTRAASDHTTATSDHTQASNDHTRAESDHSTASADHTTATSDHTTAAADHTQAESDHTTASADHTTATSDHTTATSDHTTAAADHTQAESDHTTASADHTNALEDRDNAITSTEVHYAEGTSATDAPTTGWQSDLPTVAAGNYLWSRITITFGDESTKVLYNRSVVPTVTLTEDQVTHLVTLAVGGSAFTPKLVSETKLTELDINNIERNPEYVKTVVDLSNCRYRKYALLATGKYGTNDSYHHTALECQEGDIIRIQPNDTLEARYDFLTSATFGSSGGNVESVDGVHVISAGSDEQFVVAPSGTVALAVYLGNSSNSHTPSSLILYRKKFNANEVVIDNCRVYSEYIYDASNAQGFLYKVKAGKRYLANFDVSGEVATFYAFIEDYPNESTVVTDYNKASSNVKGLDKIFEAPYDGYFVVCIESSVSSFSRHNFVEFNESYDILSCDDFICEGISKVINDAYVFDRINIASLTIRSYSLYSSSGRYTGPSNNKHAIMQVSENDLIKVTANDSNVFSYAWLLNNDNPVTYGHIPFSEGAIFHIEASNTAILKVPSSAKYMLIYLGLYNDNAPAFLGKGRFAADTSDIDYIVSSEHSRREEQFEAEFNGLKSSSPILDSAGYEVIDKVQLLNAVKKCEQLTNITFYPKRQIPMKPHDGAELTDETWYEENVKVTGFPYSSNNHIGRLSIETFMTAVNNPYSLVYSERVYQLNPHSDWGRRYANNNGWSYYGYVCCGLTSEAVGAPIKFNNPYHDEASRIQGLLAPVYPQSAEGLKVGDILDGETHSVIVIGIHYSNGQADKFRLAEESTSHAGDPYGGGVLGGAKIFEVTKATIEGATYFGRMRAYRYVRLYRNLDYEQSPFVTCTGETALAPYSYNNDICTYAGDKVSFKFGDKVVINYNLTNSQSFAYTKINLYKDGSTTPTTYLLEDIDQSTLPNGDGTTYWLDQRGHALVLENLVAGDYVAKMADDNGNESEPTTFEVVSTNVTVTNVGNDKYEIEYAGEIEAVYVGEYSYSSSSGDLPFKHFNYSSGCMAFPTFWEVDAHKMTIYPKHIAKEGGNPTYGSHLEFIIKSKYGNIRTEAYNIETGEYEEYED